MGVWIALFLFISSAFAEENPIALILEAHQNPDYEKSGICSADLVPVVDSQMRIRDGISSSDLYRFGTLSTESDFARNTVFRFGNEYPKCLLGECGPLEQYRQRISREGQAWAFSTHPSEEMREVAHRYNTVNTRYGLEDPAALRKYLSDEGPIEIENTVVPSTDAWFSRISDRKPFEAPPSRLAVLGICATYGILRAKCTADSLKDILQWMDPVLIFNEDSSLTAISLVKLLKEIVSDKLYWKGALGAARKLEARIAANDGSGDLFQDVFDAFKEAGLEKSKAYDAAWKLMAIYSTRGASIGETILRLSPAYKPLAIAMQSLATGTNVLDARRFVNGKTYSYPPNLRVSFDNGKPYYFWLTAYFARRLAGKNRHPDSAAVAAYLSQLGYQMKSKTAGHDPNRALSIEAFSPKNNQVRLDLVYSAAGARFGSSSVSRLNPNPFDLDEGMRRMLKGSHALPPLPSDEVKRRWETYGGARNYFWWKRVFNPDEPLRYFKRAASKKTTSTGEP